MSSVKLTAIQIKQIARPIAVAEMDCVYDGLMITSLAIGLLFPCSYQHYHKKLSYRGETARQLRPYT